MCCCIDPKVTCADVQAIAFLFDFLQQTVNVDFVEMGREYSALSYPLLNWVLF